MEATQAKPIKLTKKLADLFRCYDTEIRKTDSVVEHQTTGEKTTVSPVAFAVFETAMKAVYASNCSAPDEWREMFVESGHAGWYQHLANVNDFDLPTEGWQTAEKYAQDYGYCVRLLQNAGLYYSLLD